MLRHAYSCKQTKCTITCVCTCMPVYTHALIHTRTYTHTYTSVDVHTKQTTLLASDNVIPLIANGTPNNAHPLSYSIIGSTTNTLLA